jgi:hypothetical protein
MIETWDWILIYSILFLVGGLLARAENNRRASAGSGASSAMTAAATLHRPPSMSE